MWIDESLSFFLSFLSLRSLLDSGNTFAILEDQLLRRCTHTISCVSDRYDFSLSLDWIFFFFGILSSFNFVKLILKTFLLFLDCVLRDRFDPFELLPDFIYKQNFGYFVEFLHFLSLLSPSEKEESSIYRRKMLENTFINRDNYTVCLS